MNLLSVFLKEQSASGGTMLIILVSALLVAVIVLIVLKLKNIHKPQHQAEESCKHVHNQMCHLMSTAVEKTSNSIIILDSLGKIIYTNDSFKNIYGYNLNEYKDKFGDDYFKIQIQANPENSFYIVQALELKKTQTFEYYHIDKKSHQIWVQIVIDPVFDDEGKLTNWIINETDITKLKRADKEVLLQTQALTQAYMTLSERQTQIEFQKKQLMNINERLEIGYKQINRQNMTIKESLRYAQSIQNSILPTNQAISEFLDFFVVYLPKDIVSGDFYLYEKLSEKSFIIIVSDCTGHGVPGAFMSLIGYNILSQTIKDKITDPVQMLEILNTKIIEILKQDVEQNFDGMDLCICRFDFKDGGYDVTFSGTRNFIYLFSRKENKISKIRGSQRQIGICYEFIKQYQFENHQFRFMPGDFIVMPTDGLIDQCNKKRRRFGSEKLSEFLVLNSQLSMRDLGNKLVETIKTFREGAEQRDDITVFGFTPKVI